MEFYSAVCIRQEVEHLGEASASRRPVTLMGGNV
jgi:hypothetical protein